MPFTIPVDHQMTARVEDTSDGHGAQFKVRLVNGAIAFPLEVLSAIHAEGQHMSTLYVDGFTIEGGDVIISLCRGGLRLAKVQGYRNPARQDGQFLVIMREDRDEGDLQPLGRELNRRMAQVSR